MNIETFAILLLAYSLVSTLTLLFLGLFVTDQSSLIKKLTKTVKLRNKMIVSPFLHAWRDGKRVGDLADDLAAFHLTEGKRTYTLRIKSRSVAAIRRGGQEVEADFTGDVRDQGVILDILEYVEKADPEKAATFRGAHTPNL